MSGFKYGDRVEESPSEYEDLHARFLSQLKLASGDGRKKRNAGTKPPWHKDSHEAQIFSHIAKWKRGELVDKDSSAHPLVHAAWRCLAIACIETGDVPAPMKWLGSSHCPDCDYPSGSCTGRCWK